MTSYSTNLLLPRILVRPRRLNRGICSTDEDDRRGGREGQELRGRYAILAFYRKVVAGGRWVVQVATDGVIELAGDDATGRWQITETIQVKDGRALLNVGRYRDRYRPPGRRMAFRAPRVPLQLLRPGGLFGRITPAGRLE